MPIFIRNGFYTDAVPACAFTSESELERVLVDCPQLLCEDAAEDQTAQRIIIVDRQVTLDDAGRLDLLFINHEGLPVAVEVKLARNSQARREVVAQAVDYVSALAALTVDELDDRVEGKLEEAIASMAGDDDTEFDRLWRSVGTNLRAAKVRLVIAMDEANPSIERMFHFLARSSSLDVQLYTIQRYKSPFGEVAVSRRRVNPLFEYKSRGQDQPGRSLSFASDGDERVITLLVSENPKKEGSAARERFALYRSGMSVGDFLEAGGRRGDIRWDVRHKFIRLDSPPSS